MKILIIQQKRIGDVLTSSILCNILRESYPEAKIDFMCYQNCVAVLENNPNISEIVVLHEKTRKSYFRLMKFIWKIRKRKYNVVIDVYSKLETHLITKFSGAISRISYKKKHSDLFYNITVERFKNRSKPIIGLAIDNRLKLIESLVKKPIVNYKPEIFLTQKEHEKALSLLDRFKIEKGKQPVLMINILGSQWYKHYPLDRMSKIIDFCVEKTQAKILFNYIPNQIEEAKIIYNQCFPETQKNIILDLYCENLRDFLGLLSHCDALIGNEGGAVNMAKAIEIPTFSLFSPSVDKETWQLFEDDPKNISIHLKDLKPEIYEKYEEAYIKQHTYKYYDEYPFELILKRLGEYFEYLNLQVKK